MRLLTADLFKKTFRVEIVLIILILVGVFLRFHNLDMPLHGDEMIFGISALKLHHQGFEAGKDFVAEHPPLGKWFVGLPSEFINADYDSLKLLSRDMFVWSYLAYDALANNFIAMRVMEALMGTIALFLIFLITKKLFGFTPALWSTALAALSFEMVGYSRVIFMEAPMILFALLSLFLYINYLNSSGKKRFLYFGLFFISLTATLLTRHIQPLFLLPIFVVSQFFINRRDMKENIYFLLFIGISYYLVFHVIFPQDILGFGQSRFGYSSPLGFISPKFDVIGHLIFRNSFLFLASLIAMVYIAIQTIRKKMTDKIHPVLIIFFVLAFLIFSSLSFTLPRHYIFMFLPLYILGGYALHKVSSNKILLVGLILLAAINAAQLVQSSPDFLTYTNFGLDNFQSFPTAASEELENRLNALEEEKTSRVMTNDVNVLIFFKGEAIPITPALDVMCTNSTISSTDLNDITILYVPHSSKFNFLTDQFVCGLLRAKVVESNIKLLET